MSKKIHGPDLMDEAEGIVKPQYPAEIQVENIGTSSKGSANAAEDVDQWQFIFTDIDGKEIVTLGYSRGKFDNSITRDASPWITTEIKELPRHMTLDKVIASLRDAGYKEPFKSVTLRAPFPVEKNAYYVFQMEKKTVYIDALTGKLDRVVEET
ncbi:MAG: hypothetical protein ACE14P_13660 [Methanotrichaceae archaeon]